MSKTPHGPVSLLLEVERCQRTIVADEKDLLVGPGARVAAHARRPHRHSWDCNPQSIRAVSKQSSNRLDRRMSLNHIAVHQGRMARRRLDGHTQFGSDRVQVGFGYRDDRRSVVEEVGRPLGTTASANRVVHLHIEFGQIELGHLNRHVGGAAP